MLRAENHPAYPIFETIMETIMLYVFPRPNCPSPFLQLWRRPRRGIAGLGKHFRGGGADLGNTLGTLHESKVLMSIIKAIGMPVRKYLATVVTADRRESLGKGPLG